MPDIRRLVLPTPFPVGPVNAYVLLGTPLTLVDPGPAWPPAREALASGLRKLGLGLGHVQVIVITHPHLDHYGLASEVARASGAKIVAHVDAAPRLAAGIRVDGQGEKAALGAVLARAGVPAGYAGSLFGQWAAADRLAEPVEVDRAVADGDTVDGGGVTWRVISTPGHSPGAACFHDEGSRGLIAGDHLLSEISTNAIMDFEETARSEPAASEAAAGGSSIVRRKSLLIYIESLRKVAALDVGEVFPGHGEPFTGHRALIERRMRHYETRKAAIARVLADLGPSPAFRVATALFPQQTQAMGQFLALSEVLGHLDLLEAEGRVRLELAGEVDLYSLVAGPAGNPSCGDHARWPAGRLRQNRQR